MSETITFGVYLWTERNPSTDEPQRNLLQFGHRDDPTSMPDEWPGIYTEMDEVTFGDVKDQGYVIIGHDDRYKSIEMDNLGTVEQGAYRKLGEITFDTKGHYVGYRDSPPSYEDTHDEILIEYKPVYYNWRAIAV